MDLTLGSVTYRLVILPDGSQSVARAERADTGERFGLEFTAATPAEAALRLSRWLEWQHDHAAALDALQQAERTYHRAMTGAAFATAPDQSAADESRRLLEAVDQARSRLDEVRSRRPEV